MTLSYMTFLNLDIVNKPRIVEKTVIASAMESCLEQLTIEAMQAVAINAGLEPQEDNFPKKESIPGNFKQGIEEYIALEFYSCLDNILVSSVAHEDVKIYVHILPTQVDVTAKLTLTKNDGTTIQRYESASAVMKFPLGEFIESVIKLKEGIHGSIPQALILDIEEEYDVEIETWFTGQLIIYHVSSTQPPFSDENPLELFFTDRIEGFE